MADKNTRDSENIMPHNPLKSRELFAEVKDKIKGSMSWLEFDLRCIAAYLKATNSSNKVIEAALTQLEAAPAPAKEKAAKPQAKKETKPTKGTKKPGKAAKEAPASVEEVAANKPPTAVTPEVTRKEAANAANTGPKVTKSHRKTAEEVTVANATKAAKEAAAAGSPCEDTPATIEETAELAEIKG